MQSNSAEKFGRVTAAGECAAATHDRESWRSLLHCCIAQTTSIAIILHVFLWSSSMAVDAARNSGGQFLHAQRHHRVNDMMSSPSMAWESLQCTYTELSTQQVRVAGYTSTQTHRLVEGSLSGFPKVASSPVSPVVRDHQQVSKRCLCVCVWGDGCARFVKKRILHEKKKKRISDRTGGSKKTTRLIQHGIMVQRGKSERGKEKMPG